MTFVKGNIPSNKGKFVSTETKMRISRANTGKKRTEEQRKRQSERQKGRKASIKTKNKQSDSHKGKIPWNKGKKGVQIYLKGRHRSEEARKKMSDAKKGKSPPNKGKPMKEEQKEKLRQITGEKTSNWKGGISWIPYCDKFNNKLKEEVRNKYDRRCLLCGTDEKYNAKRNTGSIIKLPVHHIDYDKEQGCNGKKFELVPLCSKCNIKVNQNREYWKQQIRDKLLFYTIKEYMERFI